MLSNLKEILDSINEASSPGRAWKGKLKRIDELLSWLYDKDILNKSDKNKKDKIFNSYYRFYNDGDVPRGKRYAFATDFKKGLPTTKKRLTIEIEEELEKEIEEFIRYTLGKYAGKYDKKEFYKDQEAKGAMYAFNGTAINTYSAKSYAKRYNLSEMSKLIDNIEKDTKRIKEIMSENADSFKRIAEINDIINKK